MEVLQKPVARGRLVRVQAGVRLAAISALLALLVACEPSSESSSAAEAQLQPDLESGAQSLGGSELDSPDETASTSEPAQAPEPNEPPQSEQSAGDTGAPGSFALDQGLAWPADLPGAAVFSTDGEILRAGRFAGGSSVVASSSRGPADLRVAMVDAILAEGWMLERQEPAFTVYQSGGSRLALVIAGHDNGAHLQLSRESNNPGE